MGSKHSAWRSTVHFFQIASAAIAMVVCVALFIGSICWIGGIIYKRPEVVSHLSIEMALGFLALFCIFLLPRPIAYLQAFFQYQFFDRQAKSISFAPLPSQRAIIDLLKFKSAPNSTLTPPEEGMVISLRGEWGETKTAILRLFEKEVNSDCKDRKVVFLNAWTLQHTKDLDLAIINELAREWIIQKHMLFGFPFWKRKFSVFLAGISAQIEVTFFRASLESIKPETIEWRWLMQRIARTLKKQGERLILVVEDIDRCEPLATQRFITLIQRFFNVDNVTVILPYVPHQMRSKAFGPNYVEQTDLASTVYSLIDRECNNSARDDNTRRIAQKVFFSSKPAVKNKIFSIMESRYIGHTTIRIPPLAMEDYLRILGARTKNAPAAYSYYMDWDKGLRAFAEGNTWPAALPSALHKMNSDLNDELAARFNNKGPSARTFGLQFDDDFLMLMKKFDPFADSMPAELKAIVLQVVIMAVVIASP